MEGKYVVLFVLFCICFSIIIDVNCATPLLETQLLPNCNCNPETHKDSIFNDDNLLYNQHQAQIDKLEELVRNLSELVGRLESKLDESKNYKSLENANYYYTTKEKGDRSTYTLGRDIGIQDDGFKGKTAQENRLKTGSITKYSPFWSEKFQFMSAVNLDSVATSVNVLPFRDYEGSSKYIAVGDDRGRVYVFLRNGDVLLEFYTLSHSPVTAMLSYMSAYMNESVLVTGHSNGIILAHRLWETSVSEDLSSLHMEHHVALDTGETGSVESSISILEVHHVGRSRYILSVEESGKIKVFRENGTLYGLAVPTSRPLAFLKQRLLFLMEKGAGSLDLRTMKIRETECEGLNDSLVKNYVFDATERSKAYGFTSSGDLIHLLLLGDVTNFKCRVRSRKKFDMDEPLAFQAIKGYLLIIGQEKIYVYNVSTQHYIRSGAPRQTFSAGIEEIKSSFLPGQTVDESGKEKAIPLIASDREKLVILGLGGGYVGMYRSKLPITKGESNTVLWTSPVLFFILFLFGAWQFFAKKKEALTSWGPDDPFNSTSVTSGAPLGSGSGDRSFTDSSSRNADVMELRNNGLRGPSRRYTSPSRYPAGGGSTFRPSAVDTSSRPSSVDPNYRTTSEMKFRGSNLDSSSAFPKRRENLYDDGN
ncbi:hypothetical protein BVRB_9g202300 [Beta vulgaris subsp. vulgaris]|uniref:uncharacterized membrane protein At1g75140 n=1 Tax=Beta vulgaris subsp. vulgaris TaxID=3555 RepID=UPI0005400EFA|nr:uncharacterized membrane protein At1g75140 [Beta vulgaris subsp. vulgaris]KMT02543.1 hypothetical protein BVRB_9g202300 [Beta vulgaris subsp. vulgaris]